MMTKFNINHSVKVKLTGTGLTELRRQSDELRESFPKLSEYTPPFIDEEGYSKFQLHDLMCRLGHLCRIGLNLPFETEIILLNEE